MNAGIQVGVVTSHCLLTTQKGAPYISIHFDVDGESISGRVFLTSKAMGIARKSLKAIGFDPDMQSVKELQEDQQLLSGSKAELDIQEEEYNGQSRLVVKWINAIGGSRGTPPSDDLIAKLDLGLRSVKKEKKDDPGSADPFLPGTEQGPEGDVPF